MFRFLLYNITLYPAELFRESFQPSLATKCEWREEHEWLTSLWYRLLFLGLMFFVPLASAFMGHSALGGLALAMLGYLLVGFLFMIMSFRCGLMVILKLHEEDS